MPERQLVPAALGDQAAQALRERDAAPVDADEGDVVELVVPLDDLVCDPGERPVDRLGVEQELSGRDACLAHGAGAVAGVRTCVIPNSFPASLDRD